MGLNIFHWWSLKTRVTFFTLAIFLVGIWLLAFYASRMLREDMEHLLGEQQFSTVSYVAAEINSRLEDRIKALELIARAIDPVMLNNPPALQKFLDNRFVLHNQFNAGVFALSHGGIVLADVTAGENRVGRNYAGYDAVHRALTEGRSFVGQPKAGRNPPAPAFSIVAPIRDAQGKVIGALAGANDLGKPSFLDQFTQGHYGKSGYYLLEEPKARLIVTGTDKNRVMKPLPAPGINRLIDRHVQGYDEIGVTVNPVGVEVLASARRIPVAGWFIVAALPTAEAFAPIHALQQRILMATIFLTLLAGGLNWWMLRRQLSPMLAAVKALASLSNSTQPPQPLPITRQDEIGELIGGFNRLLKILAQREGALKESESHLRAIIENEPECIKIVDAQGLLRQMNPAGLAMIEADSQEQVTGNPVLNVIAPEYRTAFTKMHKRVLAGEAMQMEFVVLGLKGGRRWLETHAVPMQENGETVQLAVTRDITERKQAEAALRMERDQNQRYLDTTLALMVELDGKGNITMINRAAQNLLGYAENELIARNWFETCLPHPEGMDVVFPVFLQMMAGNIESAEEFENAILCRDGRQREVAWRNTYVTDAEGRIIGVLSSGADITERKEHQKQLEHIAHYDALTNLPNRVLLADRLHQGLAQAQRRKQRLAVAYLDLDGFKAINDCHGHEVGDQLLMLLANLMKQALREGDTLARLGGDEFVTVLADLADIEDSLPMLTRLLAAAAQPVHVGDLVLQVSASLGVTFFPQAEGVDADQLLRQADHAMYQAKLAGKNRYYVFDAEQDSSIRGHHESLERIRRALTDHEFELYYQPKVNMRTGKRIGAEALIRWHHPEKGLLAPALFLPVIEDHPLAIEIGEWVIDTALAQIELWHAAGLDIPVSVNVGARQLQQTDFIERLRYILAAHPQVNPSSIELEVLETSALEDLVRTSHVIEACREIGVMFALDDFGTGYSSLTYLKRLPVALLKIDQSFVRDMLDDPDDLAILDGVLGLASAFSRQVIAEGVETVEHGVLLLQLGCELAQGYGIARPMPAHQLPNWAATWRPDPSWNNQTAVSRDDLPLLFAEVEHRAWVVAFEAFLNDKRETPPPLDHHQCNFGTWMDVKGLAQHGDHPAFQTIELLHRQAHALAAELLELHVHDRTPEALARLGELHTLRDTLLGQLNSMVMENRQ